MPDVTATAAPIASTVGARRKPWQTPTIEDADVNATTAKNPSGDETQDGSTYAVPKSGS